MPVDSEGNRADMIIDPNSTISRMNLGRKYEQYINAASRDVSKMVRKLLDVPAAANVEAFIKDLEFKRPDVFEKTWEYLLGYYHITSPTQEMWFRTEQYTNMSSRAYHLAAIVKDGVYLFMPPENTPESVDMILELEQSYRPVYGPIKYVGYSGRLVTTRKNVRIGSQYIILLEKIADDGMAISSGRRQHFGVLAPITNADKYNNPTRIQAVRALGEAEIRIYTSYAGPRVAVELLDRNNNPDTHQNMVQNILRAEKPTDIISVVDRKKIPLGGSKPLKMVKHIMETGGIRFKHTPHVPNYDNGYTGLQ